MAGNTFGRITGPAKDLKRREEVTDCFEAMQKIKIDLKKYVTLITEVQTRPLAPGFNFYSDDSSGLLAAAKASLGVHDQPKQLHTVRQCKESDEGTYNRELWEGARLDTPKSGLAKDSRDSLKGRFVSANSSGTSFREITKGRALHLIIGPTGSCNVHLDSQGFVHGHDGYEGSFDLNAMLRHGIYDLGPDFLPGAYVTFGKQGWMAPMVKPEKDLDGNTKVVVGFFGHC